MLFRNTFWISDFGWDREVTNPDGTKAGANVTHKKIQDNCALQQAWRAKDNLRGQVQILQPCGAVGADLQITRTESSTSKGNHQEIKDF
jgi:hypothetical protein